MYVLTSLRPEYNDKIKFYAHLAPVAFMSNERSPVFRILGCIQAVFPVSADINVVLVTNIYNKLKLKRYLSSIYCFERAVRGFVFCFIAYSSYIFVSSAVLSIFSYVPLNR